MRPIQLTMTAFGPYKDTEIIDFEELEDHQLFVISGQTGSGKTTIFDGICFALYGSASGQDRENNTMLRSDFADDDIHTSVELIFEQHHRRFRVLRQLGHQKKGNKTPTGDKYEFYELVDGSEISAADRQMVSEINDRIEQLIGITQDQFKQIVMLPQGEFRKLLTSETENKEQILRRLFKTETYQQISERLKARRDETGEDFKKVEQQRSNYIHDITTTLPHRDESRLFLVLNEKHYNVNQVLDGLEDEIEYHAIQMKKDEKTYEKSYKKHHEHQTAYHQAKAINDRFKELEQKQLDLKKITDQTAEYERKEKQLLDAERASRITAYEEQVNSWRQDYEQKKSTKDTVEKSEQTAKNALKVAQNNYQEEQKNEVKREEVRIKLDQLNQHLPTVKDIAERNRNLNIRYQKLKTQHEQIKQLETQIKEEKTAHEKEKEKIAKLDIALSEETEKNNRLNELREQCQTIQRYTKLSKQQMKLEKDLTKEKQSFKNLQTEYRDLEQIWLSNQASVLATHLHDGEACPVCGSHTHPDRASDSEATVTREQLDRLKKRLDEQEKVYRECSVKSEANTAQISEIIAKIKEYGIPIDGLQDIYEKLTIEGKKVRKQVDELKESRKTIATLKEQHKESDKRMTELEQSKENKDKVFQEEKTIYEREKAVFEDRLEKVPEEVQVLSVLEEKIKQTDMAKKTMEKAWENAQKQLQVAEQELTRVETNVLNAHKQLKESSLKLSKVEKQFNESLKKAEFASVEQYVTAKMSEESQRQLTKEIEQYKQNRSTLIKQVNDLKEQLVNKEKINIDKLAKQLEELKEAYERAFKAKEVSVKLFDEAGKLYHNIKESNKQVAKTEKEFAMMTDLYNVTRGHNDRRISFERFLQIDYLEQIIEAANGRLKHLSNGQFLLRRSDRQEAYGRQSGLALDVHDAFTGQTRDVKTLSGGEKFNASLCLALGMSDVIQTFQGNVRIDTMFIDEGFGSLDEESLHKAIDTLIELQETGRMIGVISHVQELKTIFPAVLQVKKTREGYSETSFQIK